MIEVDLVVGVFFGVCLFAAYGVGRWRTRREAMHVFNVVLSRMDDDMGGKVTEWFDEHNDKMNEAQHVAKGK